MPPTYMHGSKTSGGRRRCCQQQERLHTLRRSSCLLLVLGSIGFRSRAPSGKTGPPRSSTDRHGIKVVAFAFSHPRVCVHELDREERERERERQIERERGTETDIERERDAPHTPSKQDRERETARARERERVCVCVYGPSGQLGGNTKILSKTGSESLHAWISLTTCHHFCCQVFLKITKARRLECSDRSLCKAVVCKTAALRELTSASSPVERYTLKSCEAKAHYISYTDLVHITGLAI